MREKHFFEAAAVTGSLFLFSSTDASTKKPIAGHWRIYFWE
jgi:hypothetical protein